MITYSTTDRLPAREYIEFLGRSDLGSEYPRKRFHERIETLLNETDVCVTARTEDERLVGVCLGVTDFAYFLFLTDLGVDRGHGRRGIGRALVALAHEAAGGPDDITMATWTNRGVMPFYEACGFSRIEWAAGKHATDWTCFTVDDHDVP